MRTLRAILGAALIVAAVPLTGHAAPVERAEEYVAGFAGDTDGLCAEDNPAGVNVGVVCISPARTKVAIAIDDLTGTVVAGFYVFTDASGAAMGSAIPFCGSIANQVVPSAAKSLVVYIGGPLLGPLTCLVDGPGDTPGIGTNGTVTATFSG